MFPTGRVAGSDRLMEIASDPAGAPDVLAAPPPNIEEEAASQLARRLFGFEGDATPLGSERDQNFLIAGPRGRAVLKISNSAEDLAVVEMQIAAALHVAEQDPTIPVQTPLPALDGRHLAEVTADDGRRHIVRLLTWMEGLDVDAAQIPFEALAPIGACSARVARALRGFFHPAAGRRLLWDLRHAPALRPLLPNVDGAARRSLVEAVLDRHDERVAPAFARLRAQVIHNDLSLGNVLVDENGRVTGILDFGDMAHTALIGELVATTVSLMRGRADPFESAAAAAAGFSSVVPLDADERELLPDLIASHFAMTVIVSAWRVRTKPENETYITGWDRDSWSLLELFDELGEAEVRRRLRPAASGPQRRSWGGSRDEASRDAPAPSDGLVSRRERVMGATLSPLSYARPIHIVRGEGVWLFDADGRAYLDAYNNVPVVGHCHPHVVDAVARQTQVLNTNTRYLHEHVVALAERLTASMPAPLDTCIFVNSGSEANDLAWRLATSTTAAAGAIVTANAYHGISAATHAFSPEDWAPDERHEHVAPIPAPDGYRGHGPPGDTAWAERLAEHVRDAADSLASRGAPLAMIMVDTALTSDGILSPPSAWFDGVARHARAAGGVYVADEVQIGFGRSGSDLWGFTPAGVVPDIVTLGKPMGNGYPIAAVVTSSELAREFGRTHEVFSTFGGNPVACAAALAVLDVIGHEELIANAAEVGTYLRRRLAEMATHHPVIGDVRGAGLLIGVELVRDPEQRTPAEGAGTTVADMMRERGVLVGSTGADDNVLKLRPPLSFRTVDADLLLDTLDEVLASPLSVRALG